MAAAVLIFLSFMDLYFHVSGDPSVELVVVPRAGKSGLQKLLCTGTGFNPEVKWLPNSGTRTGVSCKARMKGWRHMKVSSGMEVPVEEWNEGKEIICQAADYQGTVQMSTSVCAAHPSAPPQIQLEIPHLPDPLLSPHAEVTASCVVEAAPNSRVSWVLNGNVEKDASTETTQKRPSNDTHWLIVSNLTLSATEWKQHQNVTCRVKRLCDEKHEEKTVNIPAISPPTIRLEEFGQSIMCIIEGFYPKDLTIKWKQDDHEVRGLDWKTSTSDSGFYRAVSVLQEDVASSSPGTIYTCEVTHVGRTYTEHLSSRGNSPPTVRLEEFGQSIMCIIEDFYPKALTIKWKQDDRVVRGLDWKTTEKESGLYRAVSVLEADLTSSSPGTIYTCEVTHTARTYSEHLLSRAHFSVKISTPQAKELFLNNKAAIECVISGDNRKEVEGATVSWTVGGRTQTSGITDGGVTQTGSSFTRNSTLTITESVWFSGDEVMCSTSSGHKTTSEKIRVRKGATRPSITIYKPDKSVNDSDTVSLVCEVSSSDLQDVYIMWQENGGQYLDGNGMTTIKQGRTLITLSYLTVTGKQYNSSTFTCVVKDANMENDPRPRQISTARSKDMSYPPCPMSECR